MLSASTQRPKVLETPEADQPIPLGKRGRRGETSVDRFYPKWMNCQAAFPKAKPRTDAEDAQPCCVMGNVTESKNGSGAVRSPQNARTGLVPDWLERQHAITRPDRVMTIPVTDRLHEKQGRSIGRLILSDAAGRLGVYLKRHYRLGWWRGVLATLFPARAWSPGLEEWQRLKWAHDAGFPVPRPVAAGQVVGPWGRLQGFLAVEELYGMLPLHEAVPLAARRRFPAPEAFVIAMCVPCVLRGFQGKSRKQ